MILHLIDQLIPEAEIHERSRKLALPNLVLAHNSMETAKPATLSSSESNTLDHTLKMIGHPYGYLHVNYHRQGVNVPMMSLYFHSTHIFGLFFKKEGIQIAELLSPGDMTNVLVQCIAALPNSETVERWVVDTPYRTMDEAIKAVKEAGFDGNMDDELLSKLREALDRRPCVVFWLSENGKDAYALAADVTNEVCNIIEETDGVKLAFGSAALAATYMNEKALHLFQNCVAMYSDKFEQ